MFITSVSFNERFLGTFADCNCIFYHFQNLQTVHKQEAAKQCKCTIADVENALSKFTWAKGAYKKMQVLKEEGKPMPNNFSEVV